MKAKPFKFRYVNELVGGFVLLVLVLVVAAVLVAGKAQEWFVPVHLIKIDFPPEGSLGLQVGANVQILGTSVGRVTRIMVDEDGFMTGEMTVKGDFIQFVRTDSEVMAKKVFGVAGDSYVDIAKGTGPLLPEGASVVISRDKELTEMVETILNQIEEQTVPLLDRINALLAEYRGLAADLRDPAQPMQKMLASLEGITASLNQGQGPAGALLKDEQLADQIRAMMSKLEQTLLELDAILKDVRETTSTLPSMARSVEGEVQQLPGTVLQAQESLREAERLIEGLQKHWLIRKYMEPDRVVSPDWTAVPMTGLSTKSAPVPDGQGATP